MDSMAFTANPGILELLFFPPNTARKCVWSALFAVDPMIWIPENSRFWLVERGDIDWNGFDDLEMYKKCIKNVQKVHKAATS